MNAGPISLTYFPATVSFQILLVADGDTVFDADKSRPLTTLILLKSIQVHSQLFGYQALVCTVIHNTGLLTSSK
jgi:hypothetical protein